VLSTERIQAVLQRMGKAGPATMSPGIALEVARNAGADAFLSGALMQVGPTRFRLDVRAQDTAAGQILFSEKLEGNDINAVFGMVDSLTTRVAQQFLPPAQVPEKGPSIEEAATSNLEAYRHYQLGLEYHRRFLSREAIREYEEAIRLDPQFALAYLSLSSTYRSVGDYRNMVNSWQKLMPMESRLPRKDRLRCEAMKASVAGDREAARRKREAILKEFPRDSSVRLELSLQLRSENRREEAAALYEEGIRLDPNDDYLWNQLSYERADRGDLRAALEANDRYHALRPSDPNPWDSRGDILGFFGR